MKPIFNFLFLPFIFILVLNSCDDSKNTKNPCEPNPCSEEPYTLCNGDSGEAICICPAGTFDASGTCCPLNSTFNNNDCYCNSGYKPVLELCVPICETALDSSPMVSTPVLRNTLNASWDENWHSSVAIYDLDRDGSKEIIAARHSVLYVYNNSGVLLWRAPVGENSTSSNDHGSNRQYASPVVGDLDGDGNGEIAIAYDNKVVIYDHNGLILPGWPKSFPGSDGEIRSLAASDLDRDGKYEILAVKTSTGPVTVVWNIDGSVREGWPQANCDECYDYGGYNQNIGADDLDGDGFPEIISTYDRSRFGIMYADGSPYPANAMFSGPWVSSIPSFHNIDLAIQGWGPDDEDRDEFTDSPPVLIDVDGDNLPEIILYSDHERAGEYIIRGNCLWVLNPDMTRVSGFETPICSGEPLFTTYQDNIVQVAPSPAAGQLQGDSRPEIVVPSYDGNMRCYSSDGTLLWIYTYDTAGEPFIGASGAALADLNGDGVSEVIFTTYSTAEDVSLLVILDNQGTILYEIPIAGRGDMSVPTIDDIDGDGFAEIILSLKDVLGGEAGGVQIWDVNSAKTNCRLWHTGRGNYLRDGRGNR
jgi:FG-GAP-like repeat